MVVRDNMYLKTLSGSTHYPVPKTLLHFKIFFIAALYLTLKSAIVCHGCQNKIPQTRLFKQQKNLFPHGSKVWKHRIMVPAELVFSEASLLGLQIAAFFLSLCMVVLLCIYIPGVSLCVLKFSLFIKLYLSD